VPTAMQTTVPKVLAENLADVANLQTTSVSESKFTCRFFTPTLQWVDTVEVRCTISKDDPELVICDSRSMSAALLPASFPCACPASMLLFTCCFLDMGKNLDHLNFLKLTLAKAGISIDRKKSLVLSPGFSGVEAGSKVSLRFCADADMMVR